MKTIKIQSGKEISEDTVQKIKGIFTESKCPNESLYRTFDDFTSFVGEVVQFGEGDQFVEYISVDTAADGK